MEQKSTPRLVLASGSPRRKELLSRLNLPFEIIVSGVPEEVDPAVGPLEMVETLALEKAQAVAWDLKERLVIGSDTTVTLDGHILAKPEDAEDARRMLRLLRGRRHEVITGVAIIEAASRAARVSAVTTLVKFYEYSDRQIEEYVASGEPADKAGAYAIQGLGGALVEGIEGCYNNVVGFPLCEVAALLQSFGVYPRPNGPVCTLPSGEPCPRLFKTTHSGPAGR